jgi:hypothetical protein
MDDKQNIRSVQVYAGNVVEAGMVKSMLESADIQAYLQDEFNGMVVPLITSPGGMGAIKILVSSDDYERAKQIVDEYERNVQQSPI